MFGRGQCLVGSAEANCRDEQLQKARHYAAKRLQHVRIKRNVSLWGPYLNNCLLNGGGRYGFLKTVRTYVTNVQIWLCLFACSLSRTQANANNETSFQPAKPTEVELYRLTSQRRTTGLNTSAGGELFVCTLPPVGRPSGQHELIGNLPPHEATLVIQPFWRGNSGLCD